MTFFLRKRHIICESRSRNEVCYDLQTPGYSGTDITLSITSGVDTVWVYVVYRKCFRPSNSRLENGHVTTNTCVLEGHCSAVPRRCLPV